MKHPFFSVPPPVINVSHNKEVLYAGTNVSLICSISLDSAVDSDVSPVVKWYMGSRQLTNTTKLVISPTINSTSSFISNLTLTPLTDEDQGNFTCKAQVQSSNNNYVINSEEVRMSIFLPVTQRS